MVPFLGKKSASLAKSQPKVSFLGKKSAWAKSQQNLDIFCYLQLYLRNGTLSRQKVNQFNVQRKHFAHCLSILGSAQSMEVENSFKAC